MLLRVMCGTITGIKDSGDLQEMLREAELLKAQSTCFL